MWHSVGEIQRCCSCSTGHSYSTDIVPGLGTSTYPRSGPENNNKKIFLNLSENVCKSKMCIWYLCLDLYGCICSIYRYMCSIYTYLLESDKRELLHLVEVARHFLQFQEIVETFKKRDNGRLHRHIFMPQFSDCSRFCSKSSFACRCL